MWKVVSKVDCERLLSILAIRSTKCQEWIFQNKLIPFFSCKNDIVHVIGACGYERSTYEDGVMYVNQIFYPRSECFVRI